MARKIYVGNLPWSYSSADLEALFKQYGTVAVAEVVIDRSSEKSRGFGFVEMPDETEFAAAVHALNNADCGGRRLIVNEAQERTPPADGEGYGGGGYSRHEDGREKRGSGGYDRVE